MCNSHDPKDLSRRHFGALMLAGAATSVVPAAAKTAEECPKVTKVPALGVMCIDYRLPTAGVDFFNTHLGTKGYDIVALAGATLAAGSPKAFKKTVEAFYEQVHAAWTLHRIEKVVFLDHMDCGAFKVEFNEACNFKPPHEELHYHRLMVDIVSEEFPRRIAAMGLPKIGLDFWIFMDPANPVATPLKGKDPRP